MRRPPARTQALLGVSALACAALVTTAVLLRRLGLERADQVASVLAMFVGLLAFGATLAALWQARAATSGGPVVRRPPERHRTAWGPHTLPAELRTLLQATAAAADVQSNPLLGGHRRSVSTVYVRQRVEQPREGTKVRRPVDGKRRRGLARAEELFLASDRQPRVIPVRRPLDGLLDQHRHVLLEGGPGSGKTTTARQVCRLLAEGWLAAGTAAGGLTAAPLLPLLVTARALAEHVALPWSEALARAASAELRSHALADVPARVLEGAAAGVEWLVVVDGLDEVPGEEREALLDSLSTWVDATPSRSAARPYRLLITTRPLAGHATALLGGGAVGHYTLVPFDRRGLTDFARRWFATDEAGEPDPDGDDLANSFVAEVDAAGLEELTAVPLMATIAINLFQDSGTLPRNRHDLYDDCLTWLRRTGRSRWPTARSALELELADEPGGEETVAGLYDHLDELVEHLAIVRVDSRRPLASVALDWLRHRAPATAGPPPADWGSGVVTALTTTGLVTRRGNGIDFIHLTFAEYLAARAHAACLSDDFRPDEPEWRRWIHRAVHDDSVAMAVLTQWTRRHPAEPLLDWLLAAGVSYRTTALWLVAEGASSTPDQLGGALTVLEERLWRERANPGDVLSLARRFPVGPPLRRWLKSVLGRAADDPLSEVGIAALAADRDAADRAVVVARIREVLTGRFPVATRLAAAKALEQVSPAARDDIVAALRECLAAPETAPRERVSVAIRLLDFEVCRGEALDVLEAILDAVDPGGDARRLAAEAIVEADGERRDHAAGVLRALFVAPSVDAYDRVSIAESLVAVAPDTRDEVAEALAGMVDERAWEMYQRRRVAEALGTLGPAHRRSLAASLVRMAGEPGASFGGRVQVAAELGQLGEEFWPESVRLVHDAALDQPPHLFAADDLEPFSAVDRGLRDMLLEDLVSLATSALLSADLRAALAALDPLHQDHAARRAHALLTGSATWRDVSQAIALVSLLSPAGSAAVVRVLRRLLEDSRLDPEPYRQLEIARCLLRATPEDGQVAIRFLRQGARDPYQGSVEAAGLATAFLTTPAGRDDAEAVLLDVASRPVMDDLDRARLLRELLLHRPAHPSVKEMAFARLREPSASLYARLLVAQILSAAPDEVRIALEIVAAALTDPTADPGYRRVAAGRLMTLSAERRSDATAELTRQADDPWLAADERLGAADFLVRQHAADATPTQARLTRLARGRYTPLDDRLAARQTLAKVGGRPAPADDAELLEDLRSMPEPLGAFEEVAIAEGILRLFPERADLAHEYVVRALRLPGADRRADEQRRILTRLPGERDKASAALSALDGADVEPAAQVRIARWARLAAPELWHAAGETLWRVVEHPDADSATRLGAARLILEGDRSGRDRVVGFLRDQVRPPAAAAGPPPLPVLDPIEAAALLYTTVVEERARAGEYLRTVLCDPDEPAARRRAARRVLTESGGVAARRVVAAVLRADLARAGLPIEDRCEVAGELARLHRGGIDEALAAVRAIEAPVSVAERVELARTVLALSPGDRPALEALCALVREPGTPFGPLRDAVSALATGAPGHKTAVAAELRYLLAAPGTPHVRRVMAAGMLSRAIPAAAGESVAELTRVLQDPAAPALARVEAAAGLNGFGEAARAGQDALFEMVTDRSLPGYVRILAGERLVYMHGPHHRATRAALLQLGTAADRLAAATMMMAREGPSRDAATAALPALLRTPGLPAYARLKGAVLLGLDGDRAGVRVAVAVLRSLCDSPDVHPYLRLSACGALAGVAPGSAAEYLGRLWRTLTDGAAGVDRRAWAAEALCDVAESFTQVARDELRKADTDELPPRTRRRLRRTLAAIDRGAVFIKPV